MNPLKMFGLAVLTALMAMPFLGSSAAMGGATAICQADEQVGCAAVNRLLHVHLVTLSSNRAKLLYAGKVIVACDTLFLGDALEELSQPFENYVIHGHFTYANCSNGCSVAEVTGTDSLLVLLRLANDEGTVTSEGGEVTVKCPGFLSCTFEGSGLAAVAKGFLFAIERN